MTFVHTFEPVLFDLGIVQIRWYGVFLALAFYLSYEGFVYLLKDRYERRELEHIALIAVAIIFVFQRLVHVVFYNPSYFLANPLEIFMVWKGGIASHGAIIGALVAFFILGRRYAHKHASSLKAMFTFSDPVSIVVPFAGMFIRIGNFINGELVGRLTSAPWGVQFPCCEGFRHPVQLYEGASYLVVFATMYSAYRIWGKQFDGFYTGLFLLVYGLVRFGVEFFKDYLILSGGLTMGQWLSIPLILGGGYLVWKTSSSR